MKLKEVYRGDVQQYEVPVSGVLLPHFQPNLSRDRMMLRPNTTANSTFDFLRTHIATSGFARDLELRLDFSRHQPLDGDAQLIQSNETLGRLELKDNLIREDQDTLVFFQPFGDRRNRMRHSPFHPLRCDNFVVLFGCARSYVYWIPASRISESWWSDATQVNIPRRDIADCRVPIAGNLDWLEQVYRRIIEPNAGSLRKKDIRIHTQLEHYAVSRSIDDDNGDHDFDVKYYREEIKAARAQLESKPGSPWWDIERANAECAHRGYGIWFPLGHRERIAQAVFVAYEWDETEKSVFDSIGKLPADLHTGDLSPQTPCLLIKMVKTAVAYRKRNGYPSFVSGLKLDKGPLPCLYYIDCSRPVDRASPRSCILVPEEFIDYEYRNQKYADRLVKKERQGAEISSARDVLSLVGVQKGAQIIRDTDLRELITVPFSELMVRQYRDQQDALEAFLAAHEDTVKPLTWSPNLQVSATGDYAVTLARLQQEFGNEWTPTWESAYFINSHGEEDDEEDSE